MRILKSNPILGLLNSYMIDSPQPANISYMWNFGSLLGVCLIIQILTGVFLAMHYCGNVELAFASVEHIMRDVNSGWFLRYTHANVASFFFLFLYFHTARGLYYSSYRTPRAMVWTIGVIILILTMATAFLGYLYSLKWNLFYFNDTGYINILFLHACFFSTKSNIRLENSDLNIKGNVTPSLSLKDFYVYLNNLKIEPYYFYDQLEVNETKVQIKKELTNLSGIYLILNKENLEFYIGSASTNKFYSRFSNHLFDLKGSKILKLAVRKYGLSKFAFIILELFPDEVNKLNNRELLDREDFYLKYLLPNYNILTEAGSSFGYKHTDLDRKKMSENFSLERKLQIGSLNKGKSLSEEVKEEMRDKALLRTPIMFSEKAMLNMKKSSISVLVLNKDDTVYGQYPSILEASKALRCNEKTVRRALIAKKAFLRNKFKVYKVK